MLRCLMCFLHPLTHTCARTPAFNSPLSFFGSNVPSSLAKHFIRNPELVVVRACTELYRSLVSSDGWSDANSYVSRRTGALQSTTLCRLTHLLVFAVSSPLDGFALCLLVCFSDLPILWVFLSACLCAYLPST